MIDPHTNATFGISRHSELRTLNPFLGPHRPGGVKYDAEIWAVRRHRSQVVGHGHIGFLRRIEYDFDSRCVKLIASVVLPCYSFQHVEGHDRRSLIID